MQRDVHGDIVSIQKESKLGDQEYLPVDHPDLANFLDQKHKVKEKLSASDWDMIRVIEDLIGVLIKKEIINFTDLPAATQNKILKREEIRQILRKAL